MAETKCGFNDVPGQAPGQALLVLMGPTLMISIGFDPAHDPINNPQGFPIPGIERVMALVDTGATESCIDNTLAAHLNLPIVDRRRTAGAHGAQEVNVYLAQITVPSLGKVINGLFAGVDLIAGGQKHTALIGRTFLANFTMVYEGKTGTVTIAD